MSDHDHKSSACNTSGFVKIRLRMLQIFIQVYQWQNDDVQESLSVSNSNNQYTRWDPSLARSRVVTPIGLIISPPCSELDLNKSCIQHVSNIGRCWCLEHDLTHCSDAGCVKNIACENTYIHNTKMYALS